MKHILSKLSLRQLTTLEFLYYNEFSSLDQLAHLTNVSVRTISDDLNKINDFIKPLSIEFDSQNRCYLVTHENISVDYIYSQILRNSIEFRLIEKIFFERHQRLEEYADALFISLSTLKRTISRINKQIKKNGFEISTNPIQLIGDERLIINMMVNYFREKYLDRVYPFNDVEQKVFDDLFYSLVGEEVHFLNFPDMEKMRAILFVSLVRIQNGHHYPKHLLEPLMKKYDFPILEDPLFKQSFKSVFHIELTKQHIIEISYSILSDNFVFNQQELYEIGCNTPERTKAFQEIILLIDTISEDLSIDLNSEQRNILIYELVNVNLSTIAETYLIYNYKHNFLVNLTKDFPAIYHFLYNHIMDRPFFSTYEEHKIEAFIYVLITHWEGLLCKIQLFYPAFTVGIWMDSDIEHTKFMASILNQKYYNRLHFEPIEALSYSEAIKKFDNYDLILTNISNLQNNDHRTIVIDLYPSTQDLQKLYKTYFDLRDKYFSYTSNNYL